MCIRRAKGMCMIAYIAAPGGEESFYISTTPANPIRNRAGESGCTTDYINIPNGNQIFLEAELFLLSRKKQSEWS